MAEDGKPDKSPETASGQMSQQQLDALVLKVVEAIGPVMDKRISGLQGVLDKKVKELREDFESPAEDGTRDEKSRVSPTDRASRRREAEAQERETNLARREIALEFGLKPDEVEGDSESQMRINVLTKLIRKSTETKSETKTVIEEKKDEPVSKPLGHFTPLAAGGNPVTRVSGTVDDMVQRGLAEVLTKLKK